MSNLTDALIAAKLMGGSGGSGGGSGLPSVTSDDNGDVLTVVDGAWDKAAPGGGGNIAFGFDTFVSKWVQSTDYQNTYDITLYAFSGNELHAIGTCDMSRERDGETGEAQMMVGSITFTDSDYEVYEYLLYPGLSYFTDNHYDFFAGLVDGQFPTFGFFISI